MPNIKSAIKKVRKDKKRAMVNLRWRRRVKAAVKAVLQTPNEALLAKAQAELDKAAKRGVAKKNKTARVKSRLAKIVHARRD